MARQIRSAAYQATREGERGRDKCMNISILGDGGWGRCRDE